MPRGHAFTPAEDALLQRLLASGLSPGRAAPLLAKAGFPRRHRQSIHARVKRLADERPLGVMPNYFRNGKVVRGFQPEEDALIDALRVLGVGTSRISQALWAAFRSDRSQATVNMRLKALAERAEGRL